MSYALDGFVEWHENRMEGLEQGFTTAVPPTGTVPSPSSDESEGAVHIRYATDANETFTLTIHDALGRRVARGVYWAKLVAGGRESHARSCASNRPRRNSRALRMHEP